VAEEWPEDRRRAGAGYTHTGYYFGIFLAAIANLFNGAYFGWRVMVGAGVSHFGTIGTLVALTSMAFVLGLLLLPITEETLGKPLRG
jgi:hypothetical protein